MGLLESAAIGGTLERIGDRVWLDFR